MTNSYIAILILIKVRPSIVISYKLMQDRLYAILTFCTDNYYKLAI